MKPWLDFETEIEKFLRLQREKKRNELRMVLEDSLGEGKIGPLVYQVMEEMGFSRGERKSVMLAFAKIYRERFEKCLKSIT